HRRGGAPRREQAALVSPHEPQVGAAVFPLPPRQHAAGSGARDLSPRARDRRGRGAARRVGGRERGAAHVGEHGGGRGPGAPIPGQDRTASTGEALAQGIMFAGSPDTVYRQIMDFYDKVGGFGHLSLVGRSGFMTHAESEKSIRLFSNEVLPRLREIKPVTVD